MKAVIMAGGEGTRLRPITCTKPKPMIDYFGKPVMEHIIELLKHHGITEIAVTLQYMPQVVIDYFGDGKKFDVNLQYFIEDSPLGTAGSVKNAQGFLGDEFIVISGDAVTDIDLTAAINYHHEKKSVATLVLKEVDVPIEYGVVVTNKNGNITRFLEKPDWSEVFSNTANTGIYILSSSVLNMFPKNEKTDFSKDVFPQLLEDGKPIFGYVANGYWCDIGDVTAYMRCHKDRFVSYISPSAMVSASAQISEPVFIDDNAVISGDANIMPYSVVGKNAQIKGGASLKEAIVGAGATVGKNAQIRGAMICENASMGAHSAAFEGAVVGSSATIGEMSEIKSGIKVWTKKHVEKGTNVSHNIVWGNNFSRNLFSDQTVSGEVNIDITPEFATRLGATYGVGRKKVGIGYGSGGALLMLKNAFASGLLSAGCEVFDLDVTTLPITRSASRFYGLDGAVYLSYLPDKIDSKLSMFFIDKNGANISREKQRSLEQLFMRDDFMRCEPDEIANITELKDYNSFYLRKLASQSDEVSGSSVSVVCQSPAVADIAKTALENMGVRVMLQFYHDNILTIFIDDTGEKIILHDETATKLTNEQHMYLLTKILIENGETVIVLPVTASNAIVALAEANNVKTIFSKTSDADIQAELLKNKLNYQFNLMFDANYAAMDICSYLSKIGQTLNEFAQTIPSIYFSRLETNANYAQRGEVIRKLAEHGEEAKNVHHVELKEGVKLVHPDGWVMVLPHKTKPALSVVAEGVSEEFASELCADMDVKIKSILQASRQSPHSFRADR